VRKKERARDREEYKVDRVPASFFLHLAKSAILRRPELTRATLRIVLIPHYVISSCADPPLLFNDSWTGKTHGDTRFPLLRDRALPG